MSSSGAFIFNSTGWTYLIRGKAINKPSHHFVFGALVAIRGDCMLGGTPKVRM